MIRKSIGAALTGATLAVCFGAHAENKETVLTSVQMPVMVNQGGMYVDAQESMLVYPGDRILVMNGGSAQVQYANGCVQLLGGNEIAQVSDSDTCKSAAAAGTYNQVGGTDDTGGGEDDGVDPAKVVGVAAIGGIAGYIGYEIIDDDDDDNGPASP